MGYKKFKDPLYGYIEIDDDIIKTVIDTPAFQRLRSIRQTSYLPLYHTASHTRFSHSIGVYFLSLLAFETLSKSDNIKVDDKYINLVKKIFPLACLLHDVGHAPFSHSGEIFFKNQLNGVSLEDELKDCIGSAEILKDINFAKPAAPHETMSAIVALNEFENLFDDIHEKDLFARCITGYKYDKSNFYEPTIESFLNCFIELLNSSVIDVDKLDYLIRDTFITGYASVSIDYIRLLKALDIVMSDKKYNLVFNKSALSVIENFVYAHDYEKKWIQNHPVILYDIYLIDNIIKNVEKMYGAGKDGKLFSRASLSKNGNKFTLKNYNRKHFDIEISLLSDIDILFSIKNLVSDSFIDEYYNRNNRRHPIWKSEAEFNLLVDGQLGKTLLKKTQDDIEKLNMFISQNYSGMAINQGLIDRCNQLRKEVNRDKKRKKLDQHNYLTKIQGIDFALKWTQMFQRFSDENTLEFDYVIISTDKFNSNFSKSQVGEIQINFPILKIRSSLDECSNILKSLGTNKKFFYVFYRRNENTLDTKAFIDFLRKNV